MRHGGDLQDDDVYGCEPVGLRLHRQTRDRVIRHLAQAAARALKELRRQQHVRLDRHHLADRLVADVMQAFDPHAVDAGLADLIPRAQRAEIIAQHEETGAEHVERVRIARIATQYIARERRGVAPPALREADAAQLPDRTSRGWTLGADRAQERIGVIEAGLADLIERAIQPYVAHVDRARHV
jgi:hypothetical protein